MLRDEEEGLVRLAVEFDRLNALRQLVGRGRVRPSSPLRLRRRPNGRAVALYEVVGAAVVRGLGQQHPNGLAARVEAVIRWQERIDQRDPPCPSRIALLGPL